MKNKINACVSLVLGGLIVVAPQTFLPICKQHDGMWMACHWTAQMSLGLGIAIVVIALILILSQSPNFIKGLYIGQGLFGGLIIATTTVLIGVCDSHMMKCNSITKPVLIIFGLLTIIVAIVGYLLAVKESRDIAQK
jgi:hypothetical protein